MGIWYRQGTASITNGAAAVTGALTGWLSQVKAGDAISFDAGAKWYEVLSIEDNTGLTLATNFAESTVTGGPYEIQRTSPKWSLASDTALKVAQLLGSITTLILTSGVPDNGVGTDGAVAIDHAASKFYLKSDGAWDAGTDLRGPIGLQGLRGRQGKQGIQGPIGSTGAAGPNTGLDYAFNTGTTDADPGNGNVRFNNSDWRSATFAYISKTGRNSEALGTVLANLFGATGPHLAHVRIFPTANRAIYLEAEVSAAIVDGTAYWKIPLSGVQGSASMPSSGNVLSVSVSRTGDLPLGSAMQHALFGGI